MNAVPQRIAPSEILAWLEIEQVTDRDERAELVEAIRSMEGAYFAWLNEQKGAA